MKSTKMNVLFDASILVDGEFDNASRCGIYFVAQNVLNEMLKRNDVNVILYSMPSKRIGLARLARKKYPQVSILRNFSIILPFLNLILYYCLPLKNKIGETNFFGKVLSYVLYQMENLINALCVEWRFLFNTFDVSAYFSPYRAAPWHFAKQRKMKKYVVLYDVIPYKISEYRPKKSGGWFSELVKNLNRDDSYFAISKSAKDDFLAEFPVLKDEQISVTHLAANDSFAKMDCVDYDDFYTRYKIPKDKKFIFSLCTLEPRKNLIRAVKTFIEFVEKNNIDDLIFILGGRAWSKFVDRMKQSLSNPALLDRYVMRAGYISDQDLPLFYNRAEWFVFTSQYEGFGLPPLEAMQCGCPVITSNNTSLPEVIGDAGIMIDWDSDEQHIAAYEKYYFDKELREQYAKKGLERSLQFSWKKTVDEMLRVMNEKNG